MMVQLVLSCIKMNCPGFTCISKSEFEHQADTCPFVCHVHANIHKCTIARFIKHNFIWLTKQEYKAVDEDNWFYYILSYH